ncbi:MAG: SusC/RagA family TonB-linked outer membrane protein [Polaribacter sp.]|nr:SusC/RagA family TonB-linked outer membrane protein [Polaribacter sp.]
MKKNKIVLIGILILSTFTMFAQQTLNGVVKETATGDSLPGVNVVIKGTTNGTSSDFDGKFQLSNVKTGDVIIFSSIGFQNKEVTIGANFNITVTLNEESQKLDEVVIVGYGTTTVRDATGSITSIKAKDLNKTVVSADQMLIGKIAGVSITTGGGAPGSGSAIRIRGGASLNASNDPLFIIDGVPVDSEGVSGMRNPLNSINPNDIESYTVLKDASATAIYGSRASNGVIIITTKKGNAGGLVATYNANFSVHENIETVDALSAAEFTSYVTENGLASDIALLGSANTDWQKEIFRIGYGNNHYVSLKGGDSKTNYRASIGRTNQTGTLLTSELTRSTYAVNIGTKLFNDRLKVDVSTKASFVDNRFANSGAISNAIGFDPTKPVHDSNAYGGYFQWLQSNGDPITVGAPKNPVALLEQENNTSRANRILGNFQFDYTMPFLPELRANLNLGYDLSYSKGDTNTSNSATASTLALAKLGNSSHYEQDKKNLLSDFYLNYKKDFASINSSIDVMAGYSYQNIINQGFSISNLQDLSLSQTFDYFNELNLQSFFGRVKYSFDNKYLLTLTYRRDGTSRFSKNNRWADFPSAALAWKISEEDFLNDSSLFSNLKLRASWGITGQQNVGSYYPAIATYLGGTSTAQYQFGSSFLTTFRAEPFNSTLKWEETETTNIGLDFGFLNGAVNGSIDGYYRKTTDLLNFIPFPGGSSLSNAGNANIGSMENKGIELSLNSTLISKDDLSLDIAFNATYAETEITKLTTNDGPDYEGVPTGGFSGGVGNTVQRHTVGYAPNSFFVYQQVYNADGKPLEGVYVDRNNDGVITNSDKYRFEKPTADVTLGFTSTLNYKNWNFNMAWRASLGNYVYNNVDSNLGFRHQLLNAAFPNVISNGVHNVVESGFINGGAERYLSDYYVQDASFVRLDNINIGYNFGEIIGKGTSLSMSGSVQNVLTITNYEGLDPEVFGGIDYNIYPRPRIITLGVNLNF